MNRVRAASTINMENSCFINQQTGFGSPTKNGARGKFSARRMQACRPTRRLLFVGGALVGGANQLHVFGRVLVEILFAARAAQFHFLSLVNEHQRLAHVAAEFLLDRKSTRLNSS